MTRSDACGPRFDAAGVSSRGRWRTCLRLAAAVVQPAAGDLRRRQHAPRRYRTLPRRPGPLFGRDFAELLTLSVPQSDTGAKTCGASTACRTPRVGAGAAPCAEIGALTAERSVATRSVRCSTACRQAP